LNAEHTDRIPAFPVRTGRGRYGTGRCFLLSQVLGMFLNLLHQVEKAFPSLLSFPSSANHLSNFLPRITYRQETKKNVSKPSAWLRRDSFSLAPPGFLGNDDVRRSDHPRLRNGSDHSSHLPKLILRIRDWKRNTKGNDLPITIHLLQDHVFFIIIILISGLTSTSAVHRPFPSLSFSSLPFSLLQFFPSLNIIIIIKHALDYRIFPPGHYGYGPCPGDNQH